ncbi:MAG: hypothetical protein KGZ97_07820 [Bacteroidetes bacterium]|nr:hypothetical protein [Bacteroidota bacterium]
MKKFAIILSFISLLIACGDINNINEKQTEFENYSNKIEKVKLPLETNCNKNLSSYQYSISD